MRGKWSPAIAAAFLVAASACSPQCGSTAGKTATTPLAARSPIASPSPSPTAPLHVAAMSFHAGEVGLNYSPVTPSAGGGLAPYAWSISTGALPPGLVLNANGTVSGSPTEAGAFGFTLHAADAGGSGVDLAGQIAVAPALSAAIMPSCAQACAVELGCAGACGGFGRLSGGLGPYTYTLTSGSLPAGTSLSGLALAGTFTGLTGYLKFTVQVTDALGATTSVSPTFWMYQHVALAGGSIGVGNTLCFWTGGQGCSGTFPYSGGTPNAGVPAVSAAWASYTQNCSAPPCGPPPMPAITVGGGAVTVTVPPGGSAWSNGYRGTLVLTLTNQDVCAAGPSRCSATASVQIVQQAS